VGKLELPQLQNHTVAILKREDDKLLISSTLEGLIVVWVTNSTKTCKILIFFCRI
jgi:hypothetical protein